MRLNSKDYSRLHDIQARLRILEIGGPSALEALSLPLRELLDFSAAGSYGIEHGESGWVLSFCHIAGSVHADRIRGAFRKHLTEGTTRWGMWNPLRPERKQRNIPVALMALGNLHLLSDRNLENYLLSVGYSKLQTPKVRSTLYEMRDNFYSTVGFKELHQLRALVCDGTSLLAWVGGYRPYAFNARDLSAFRVLIPTLSQRLRVERFLEADPDNDQQLIAALDEIPRAVFMTTATGRIRHANTIGRTLFESSPINVVRKLADSIRRPSLETTFEATPISAKGMPRHYLVMEKSTRADVLPYVARAAKRWNLTASQAQVLAYIAKGEANKTIAAELGRATHTVELHVSAILRKAGVGGRAALIAALWRA